MRVVSLLPSATEIVFALGCGDSLVGVTFECDYPPEARQRRVVSTSTLPSDLTAAEIDAAVTARVAAGQDLYQLDEGALAQLAPDIVLTQDLCAVCAVDLDRVDDALDYLGCRAHVVTLDPRDLEGVMASIVVVGRALGCASIAGKLVERLRGRIDKIGERVAGMSMPTVLTLEWTDPPFSAGHWVPDVVRRGGGNPVLDDGGRDSRRLDWDAVRSTPADCVFVAPCGYHLDDAVAAARALVAAGRVPAHAAVWAVDADSYFVRPGPRLVDGVELVAAVLHPAQCGPPDPSRAAPITDASAGTTKV